MTEEQRTEDMAVKGLLDVFKKLVRGRAPIFGDKPKDAPSEQQSRAILERYTPKFERDVTQFTRVFLEGRGTSQQWVTNIGKALFQLYFTGVAAAAGNVQGVRQAMLDDIGRQISAQRPYLERLAQQIDSDKAAYDVDKVVKRLMQYSGSAKPLISKAKRKLEGRPDLPFEPADRTMCFGNCRCRWGEWKVIDAEKGDYDVKWIVNLDDERCPTCRRRGEICNPLEIRGNVIKTDLSDPGLYRD